MQSVRRQQEKGRFRKQAKRDFEGIYELAEFGHEFPDLNFKMQQNCDFYVIPQPFYSQKIIHLSEMWPFR